MNLSTIGIMTMQEEGRGAYPHATIPGHWAGLLAALRGTTQ
jgi:hypothetical protein